jgi:hypothetical protein
LQAFRFRLSFVGYLLCVILVADVLVLSIAAAFPDFYREEGTIETVQLFLVAATAIGFAGLTYRVRHAARLVAAGAASLCVLFFFREFETPIHHPVLDFMSHGPFRFLLASLMGGVIGWQTYINRAHLPAFLGWLKRVEWWPFLVAGIFLVAGALLEKMHMQLIEETVELDGYIIIAATAAGAWSQTIGQAALRPVVLIRHDT